jgi:hypothetical protein
MLTIDKNMGELKQIHSHLSQVIILTSPILDGFMKLKFLTKAFRRFKIHSEVEIPVWPPAIIVFR